jgi:hypothetical protein
LLDAGLPFQSSSWSLFITPSSLAPLEPTLTR